MSNVRRVLGWWLVAGGWLAAGAAAGWAQDVTPPTVNVSTPLAGALVAAATVDVVGTAVDPGLASVTVNGVNATLSGSSFLARLVPLAEGTNELTVEALDSAGNSRVVTRAVTRDTLAPEVVVTDPAPGAVVPGASILVTGTVVEPQLDRVEVAGVRATVSGSTFRATVPLVVGANDLQVRAIDRAGHVGEAQVAVERDNDAPAVRITSPPEGARLRGEEVAVAGTVAVEPGLTVTVNGLAATLSPEGTFAVPAVPLVEGSNPLIARGVDALGNAGVHTRVVTRDTVAPQWLTVDPADGAFGVPPEGRFVVTFSEPIDPASAAAGVRLETAAGSAIAVTRTVAGAVVTLEPTAVLPSRAALRLMVTSGLLDLAGNPLAQPRVFAYQVADREPPPPLQLTPAPPNEFCGSALPVAGTTEPFALVEVVGGAATVAQRADETGSFALGVPLLPGVPNRLALTARDPDGNRSVPLPLMVTHDCVPPRVVAVERQAAAIVITFSEPLAPASVAQPGGVQLSGAAGPVAGTVSQPAAERVHFSAALPAGALRLEVGRTFTDRAGNTLAYAHVEVLGASAAATFLEGRALDAATGQPLAGALVVVDSTNGVVHPAPRPEQGTGLDGRFRLPVPAGTHLLVTARAGYTPVFRQVQVSTEAGGAVGVDVFDPWLTPAAAAVAVPGSGGVVGRLDGARVEFGPTSLPSEGAAVSLTELAEQALPARLPYGWSPLAAFWLEVEGGGPLTAPAALTAPVVTAPGQEVVVARLDLTTLQWWVVAVEPAAGGAVVAPLDRDGAWIVVVPDDGPLAPPPALVGNVLGSAPPPTGDEVTAATLSFDPTVVLPTQTARVTVTYTLAPAAGAGPPSGAPLSVTVREELTGLDGTVRRGTPFAADLVLYHHTSGANGPSSRFVLRPSDEAAARPLQQGAEDVTVRCYEGGDLAGNVLGPAGGTVGSAHGDAATLPAGALAEPAAVSLTRRGAADLPRPAPAGSVLVGVLELDLAGRELVSPAGLSYHLGTAPGPGEAGLLLQVLTTPEVRYRVVARLAATATGWETAPIDLGDLPLPGVRTAGLYAFVRLTAPVAYFRGTVTGLAGAPAADVWLSAAPSAGGDPLGWGQLSLADGRYALPAPLGAWAVRAEDSARGDAGAGLGALAVADERVTLDLALLPIGPQVVALTPAAGATGVPPGLEPTVRFSEPVDPATLATGVVLYATAADAEPALVPATVTWQGLTARLVPRATLSPGGTYELRVTSSLRDLAGNRLSQPVTAAFTVRAVPVAAGFDLSRVRAYAPGADQLLRVVGAPGAVPAGSLVFLENTSRLAATPAVTAATDGSFELTITAQRGDRVLLHVVPPGANELVAALSAWLDADGRGAEVGPAGGVFTTADGWVVEVPAGAFAEPVPLRLVPFATPAEAAVGLPLPTDFTVHAAFRLETGDVEPALPLHVSFAAPAGSSAAEMILARRLTLVDEPFWMPYHLLRREGGRYTTLPPPGTQASLAGLATGLSFAAFTSFADRQRLLPGVVDPGVYLALESAATLDWASLPTGPFSSAFYQSLSLDGLAIRITAKLAEILPGRILVPNRRNQTVSGVGRDLTSGYRLFTLERAPLVPDSLEDLPVDAGDREPPVPVSGSPIRFFLYRPVGFGAEEVAPGLVARLESGGPANRLVFSAAAGRVPAGTDVRLLGLDDGGLARVTTAPNGSFEIVVPGQAGRRYLLALGAAVAPDERFEIEWSEALRAELIGFDVVDSGGHSTAPHVSFRGSRERVQVAPSAGWRVGETYRLILGTTVLDAAGNSWGGPLEVAFTVEGSRVVGEAPFAAVRDVVSVGSWLLVAADSAGLAVIDTTNPAALGSPIAGALTFPFPLNDPVTGLAVDAHGRVLVAGGGLATPGQVKIFDPFALDLAALQATPGDPALRAAAFAGSTLISDPLSGGTTTLPDGTPRRIAVLADDDRAAWRAGGAAPAGLVVLPAAPPEGAEGAEPYLLTVSGSGSPGHPVSLHNRSRGRMARTDAAADGTFTVSVEVQPGDQLELLTNRRTLAYVVTRGAGLQVVDVDAFYREAADNPVLSDLLGNYDGSADPNLRPCDEPVSDLAGALLDLGVLIEPRSASGAEPPHRLTVAGLLGFRGVVLFESDPADLGEVSAYNDACLRLGGSPHVAALEALPDYVFVPGAMGTDYLLVAHRTQGLLILDATDRDQLVLVGWVRLPGEVTELGVDRLHRRVYLAGPGTGIYSVALDGLPKLNLIDTNQDGRDDRLVEVIPRPQGNPNAPLWLVPELGLAFTGGTEGAQLASLVVASPELAAVTAGTTGPRQVTMLAPHGVPTGAESAAAGAPDRPGSFRVLARLPGGLGATVAVEVRSVGPGGELIAPAGATPELPPPSLVVSLQRQSADPRQEGYSVYLSEEIALIADLRASRGYMRSAAESSACVRCEVPPGARELLSGESVEVRPSAALQGPLEALYGVHRASRWRLTLPSVRWELAPGLDPEPAQSASLGSGEVAGVLLHSGEAITDEVDLQVAGRGLGFVFTRAYRSQSVGGGALGPGWSHNFSERLRELPNGQVERYDGQGRREVFTRRSDGTYQPPPGRFVSLLRELGRTSSGWLLRGAHGEQRRFDRWGRLVSVADAHKDSADSGNELRLDYDPRGRLFRVIDELGRSYHFTSDDEGRLTQLEDFSGRRVRFEYDLQGRLTSVRGPAVTLGPNPIPEGAVTRYEYRVPGVGLTAELTEGDDLTAKIDPRGATVLRWSYGDGDGDGRTDEVNEVGLGAGAAQLAYLGAVTRVVDRRGKVWETEHNGVGHPVRRTDPLGGRWVFGYDAHGNLTSQRSPEGVERHFEYPSLPVEAPTRSAGNMLRYRFGLLSTTVGYDVAFNRPEVVVDARGTRTEFDVAGGRGGQPGGQVAAPGTPDERTSRAEYDPFGRVTLTTNGRGHTTRYDYGANGFLRSVTVTGGVSATSPAVSLTTQYETDPRGNVTAMVDPRGVRTEYRYDELDRLYEEIVPSLGYRTVSVRDEVGQVTEVRRPAGVGGSQVARTRVTYGPLGEVLTVSRELTAGEFATETRAYDAGLLPLQVTLPEGGVITFEHDDRGWLQKVSRGGPGVSAPEVTTYQHDGDGRLVSETDGEGETAATWTRVYDELGRPVETKDPLGQRVLQVYDAATGDLVQTQSLAANTCLWAQTEFSYNALGEPHLTAQWLWEPVELAPDCDILPPSARRLITETTFDDAGNLILIKDPLGRVIQRSYDGAERLVRVEDSLGNRQEWQLDGAGLAVETRLVEVGVGGPATVVTRSTFDALGRATAVADGLGHVWRTDYDVFGSPVLEIDPTGAFTSSEYDLGGRRTLRTQPHGVETRWSWDREGRVLSEQDARGNTTTWSYDALGRPLATTYADGTSESFQYNPRGLPVTWTEPRGSVVTQTFDKLGRLTARAVDRGPGVVGPTAESFAFDPLGNVKAASSGNVTTISTIRRFDSLGRRLEETVGGRTLLWSHDDAGALDRVTYPSGVVYEFQRDEIGRPFRLAEWFDNGTAQTRALFSWQGGRPESVTRGSLRTSFQFDGAGRWSGQTHAMVSGPPLWGEALTRTARGQVAHIAAAPESRGGLSFAYDGARRMTSFERSFPPVAPATEREPAAAFAFAYDTAQNLLSQTAQRACANGTTTFPLDSSGRNRPAAAGSVREYDDAGNLTVRGNRQLEYDFRNRLTRVTDLAGASEVALYEYDAFDRRVKKTVAGVTSETTWDGWEPIEEWQSNRVITRRLFGPSLGQLVRQEVDLDGTGGPESVQLPIFDALGNLSELRREDGALIERYEYTPFGNRSVYLETSLPCQALTGSLAANQIGFHGLLEDPETGLLYARNRYYDPDMGRFVTTDPLGSVDGPNRYQFVGNDPVNGRDPLGLYDFAAGEGANRGFLLSQMNQAEREAFLVAEWRSQREAERPLRIAASVGLGFVPVAGELHDGSQVLTGYDWIAGEHLTLGERATSGAAFVLPVVGASLLRYGKKGIEGVQSLWRSTFGGPRLFEGVDEAIIAGAREGVEGLEVEVRGWVGSKGDHFAGVQPGTLSDQAARKWYHDQLAKIHRRVNPELPIRMRAIRAFTLRNDARTATRDLMANRALAESLPPNRTLREMVRRAYSKGYSGDSLWQYIYEAAVRSNEAVDAKLGF